MSARMEMESLSWEGVEPLLGEVTGRNPVAAELECLFRNSDQGHLVAQLREARAELAQTTVSSQAIEAKSQAALALQEQWNSHLAQREQLRADLRRGKEYLEQVQKELSALRSRMEEWPAYERICGKNPMSDYVQNILVKERIELFLPGWLRRREEQLQSLNRELQTAAQSNGLEHLV